MRYFKKELVDTPVYLPSGGKLTFQDAGGGTGLMATEDAHIIGELEKLVASHRGGVQELTAEAYEELKKKLASKPQSLNNSALRAQVFRQVKQAIRVGAVPATAGGAAPKPLAAPNPNQSPRPASQPLEVPELFPMVGQVWRRKEATV